MRFQSTPKYGCGALYPSEATGLQWWNGEEQTCQIQLTRSLLRTEPLRTTMWLTRWLYLSIWSNFHTLARPSSSHPWDQLQWMHRTFQTTRSRGFVQQIWMFEVILRYSIIIYIEPHWINICITDSTAKNGSHASARNLLKFAYIQLEQF